MAWNPNKSNQEQTVGINTFLLGARNILNLM